MRGEVCHSSVPSSKPERFVRQCDWWVYRTDKHSSFYQLIELQSENFIYCRQAGACGTPGTDELNSYKSQTLIIGGATTRKHYATDTFGIGAVVC